MVEATNPPQATGRERAFSSLARLGWDDGEIAMLLGVDADTASRIAARAVVKLGAESVPDDVERARRRRMVD